MDKTKEFFIRNIYYIVLVIIVLLAAIVRLRFLNAPLIRDEGEYAYAAQVILQGGLPYVDSYGMRLPGIYLVYAIFFLLFGQTQYGIHLGLLIVNSASIILLYMLSRFFLNKLCSIVSIITFAMLSFSCTLQGIHANSEHFVVFFILLGLYVFFIGLKNENSIYFFFSGWILGCGVLMKQSGIFFISVPFFYLALSLFVKLKEKRKKLFGFLTIYIFGIIIFFSCFVFIIWYIGIFREFWFWTFTYASKYISYCDIYLTLSNLKSSFIFVTSSAPFLWLWIGLGLICFVFKFKSVRYNYFLILFCISSIISVTPGFYFRPQYYLLLLPCACIASGFTFACLTCLFDSKKVIGCILVLLLFLLCIFQSVYLQWGYLFTNSDYYNSRMIYGVNPFVESLEIAKFLEKHTDESNTIAVFGSEPQIYFYSKRRSATPFMYMYPMMEKNNFSSLMQKEFIYDINLRKPRYIIFIHVSTSWLKNKNSHTFLYEYLNKKINEKIYNMVALIELYKNETHYFWSQQQIKFPPNTKNWIAIYELSVN